MGFKLTPPFPGQGASKPHAYPNGKDMIIVDGVAKEAGSEGFPWEREANNGNKNGTV